MYDEKISETVKKKYFEMNLNAAKTGLVDSMNVAAKLLCGRSFDNECLSFPQRKFSADF